MVALLDEIIGNITGALRAKGLWEDTLMVVSRWEPAPHPMHTHLSAPTFLVVIEKPNRSPFTFYIYIYTSWVSPLTRLQLNAAATASCECPSPENVCVLLLPPTQPTRPLFSVTTVAPWTWWSPGPTTPP
jgi:hypothetical protein